MGHFFTPGPMMTGRDDFSEGVKRVLAERAAYLCSYQGCRELTVMPSSDPEKAIRTGRAAHIHAASPNGPRYDPNQTAEERSSIHNAIHLCTRHADVVDRDETAHSADTLREWKRSHEAWVAQSDLIPAPPRVSVATIDGLLVTPGPNKVTGEMMTLFRDHLMCIEAMSRHELLDIELHVVFPEAVVEARRLRGGGGPRVSIRREEVDWQASAGPGGSWEIVGGPRPTPLFVVRVDVLRAGRPVELAFRCIPDSYAPDAPFGHEAVYHYIDGKFLYRHRDQFFERFWADRFDIDADRRVTCRPLNPPFQLIKQVRFP